MLQQVFKAGLTAAIALSAGMASAQSLSDALATAYKNSGILDQQRAVLRAADEGVAQSVALLRPVISYTGQVAFNDTSTFGSDTSGTLSLQANMLLFDFGQTQLAIEAQKETVLATRAALVDAENTILLSAAVAFLEVRRAEAFVGLLENNVRLLSEQLRATQDRFDVGEVTRTDVSLARARLAASRSGLAAQRGGLERAEELYRVAVGEYPSNLLTPPAPPSVPSSESAAQRQAERINPLIDQVQHQIAAAELLVEQSKRSLRPALTGNGTVSVDDDGNDSFGVGVTLSGPIYQGGALASQIRQAKANRDQIRAALYNTGLAVTQDVGDAYADLAVAVASIEASRQQVEAAELALEGIIEERSLGARTTLDVLDQENELLDAQTSLVAAEIDRYIAAYAVLDAIGLLTVGHLGLNVPTYDPAAYYNAVKSGPTVDVSPQGEKLDRVFRALGKK